MGIKDFMRFKALTFKEMFIFSVYFSSVVVCFGFIFFFFKFYLFYLALKVKRKTVQRVVVSPAGHPLCPIHST